MITGVSRNIGKSIASKFLLKGYNVIGVCRSKTEEESLQIVGNNKCFSLYTADFCDMLQLDKLISELKNYTFDVVINNAGMLNLGSDNNVKNEFNNFVLHEFEMVMNCNFYAPLRICLELKENIKQGGTIINIASGCGMRATYASLSYSTSKAALINLTQSLSNSFYPYKKIRVNSVSPGWIDPDELSQMGCDKNSPGGLAAKLTSMGRNGKPQEIADVVYYLTTKQASFINGANIVVDGGWLNHNVIYYEEATGERLLKE